MKRLSALLVHLRANTSGAAMVEFAVALPLLLTAGLYGAETANLALTHMKVSQVAAHIADNASRIGDTSTIVDRKIFESDINDLIAGSNIQAGRSLNFYEHGRAIVSSLEVFDQSQTCKGGGGGCPHGASQNGRQFIHWQRCKGKRVATSAYGNQHDIVVNGMGPAGQEVTAEPGGSVIYVEVFYTYQPLISNRFFGTTTIRAESSFIQRNNVDLTGLKQKKPMAPDNVSACNVYSGLPPVNV